MAGLKERRGKQGKFQTVEIREYSGRNPRTGRPARLRAIPRQATGGRKEIRVRSGAQRQAPLVEARRCREREKRIPLGEYARYVLQMKEREGLKHSTLVLYRELLERIQPVLGEIPLQEVRPWHLNDFYEQLSKMGARKKQERYRLRKGSEKLLLERGMTKKEWAAQAGISRKSIQRFCCGPGVGERVARQAASVLKVPLEKLCEWAPDTRQLSATTIRQHHQFLSCVFAEAERELRITMNPARLARPPRPQTANPKYFQLEQLRQIRQAAEQEPLPVHTFIHLLMVTGCRRGELLGLRWSRIDWMGGALRIERTILYTPERGVYEDTPKTAGSVRTITLPEETLDLLLQYRQERRQQGIGEEENYLFCDPDGAPLCPARVTYLLQKFGRRYGLPPMNAHAFRHTQASVLFFQGLDSITISKRLGHSRVSTTTDLYSHLLESSDRRASQCVAEAMLREPDGENLSPVLPDSNSPGWESTGFQL